VYRSTNAFTAADPTFTSIQNDLPTFPVHDAVIDRYDANRIIIATEMGVWATDNAGQNWTEENEGIGRVPALNIEQEQLYTDGCYVIYLGTHGRGFFRTTTLTSGSCETSVGMGEAMAIKAGVAQAYPNPATTSTQIVLPVQLSSTADVMVFDLTGNLVHQLNGAQMTNGRLLLDTSHLRSGKYIVRVVTDNKPFSARLIVIN
jgi:hypothetical protein